MSSTEEPFRILIVCTGNVCRSPMAERLLRAGLAERWGDGAGVEVTSAGTGALVGEPMTPQTAVLVSQHGGDPDGHRARQLTEALVAEADLVLALTRAHRSAVVEAHPLALRRAFTLREAGRLAAAAGPVDGKTPAERLRDLVTRLRAARGQGTPVAPSEDDVVDPYRRPEEVHRLSAAQIVPALDALLRAVAGDRS